MADFVQLWVYLSATPLFGLTATLVVYLAAHAVYVRAGQAPWANPVLWSVVSLACALLATGVPYPSYFAGAQFVAYEIYQQGKEHNLIVQQRILPTTHVAEHACHHCT